MRAITETASILELVRLCSQSSSRYFAEMGQDLDRKMGAALAAIRVRGLFQSPPPAQLSSRAGDVSKGSDRVAFPEQSTELDLSQRCP